MVAKAQFVQISDSHLFAEKTQCHHGANIYQNLFDVLNKIKQLASVQFVVFTGDLTQDHTQSSYQNFAQAVREAAIKLPIYYLAGNHDEPELLRDSLSGFPFEHHKQIDLMHWQVQLLDSKSETPAGHVSRQELERVTEHIDTSKHQLLMMHHHPVDVGYFIDRHGLINKSDFYLWLEQTPAVKAVACGHVHNDMTLSITTKTRALPLYTCPSTSIQFDKKAATVANSGLPAGFRLFTLGGDGQLSTEVIYI